MPAYDLIIRNGTIVDGTGAPGFRGDVAVKDGLIAAVGTVHGDAEQEIDAGDRIVAPGWVDIHTHYDGQATWDAEDHSLVYFRVEEFLPYREGKTASAFDELRAACGGAFDTVRDVVSWVAEERGVVGV